MNTEALISAQNACDLCPESTNAWVLLAHCYFVNKEYEKVKS